MAQQTESKFTGETKQVCFLLLDAHLASLDEQARKHGLPRTTFVQWIVREYLHSVEDDSKEI